MGRILTEYGGFDHAFAESDEDELIRSLCKFYLLAEGLRLACGVLLTVTNSRKSTSNETRFPSHTEESRHDNEEIHMISLNQNQVVLAGH